MPNWVDNKLLVIAEKGKEKNLREILDTEFQFQTFLPIPFDLDTVKNPDAKTKASSEDNPVAQKEMIEKYGAEDWYHWCLNNWGTKWDRSDYEVVSDEWKEGSIEVFFRTPWSPPTEILKIISKKYGVRIIDHFEEEGFMSAGHLEFKNGQSGLYHYFKEVDK